MLTYNLFSTDNLKTTTYKTQNTPSVSLVELNDNYIELKKFLKKSTTYTQCKFHFIDSFVPIQLKQNALPFTYFEHIWNVSAILNWDNKGILQQLGLSFSIHNVKDIYPEIYDTVVEHKILENQDLKIFYVKDLRFRVTIIYNDFNSYDITFKEIDGVYKPVLISDIPKNIWIELLDKYSDDLEVESEIEIKYTKNNKYYLSLKLKHQDKIIEEQYYPSYK